MGRRFLSTNTLIRNLRELSVFYSWLEHEKIDLWKRIKTGQSFSEAETNGKSLISLGGLAAIDNMFSDLRIWDLKALDIGFGIGGVAFYLAEKYKIKVTGIEIHPWMVTLEPMPLQTS